VKRIAITLLLAVLTSTAVRAQSTAFTYQGALDDAGVPSNGVHDFRFKLFNLAVGGVVVGAPVCVDDVNVVDGVFTVQLDFGQQFATTAQRYLEIEVRRDTGLTCGNASGFVVMSPRQQITSAPMASHASSAFALDASDGSPSNAVYVDDSGRVGVGTTTPQNTLHVNGGLHWGGAATQFAYSGIDGSGLFVENKATSSATSRIRFQTSKAGDQLNYSQFFIDPYAGFYFLNYGTGSTRVGIGTATPTAQLDVRGDTHVYGDVWLGDNSGLLAPGGWENLKIIRGEVAPNGNIASGSGFSIADHTPGRYIIAFTSPFAGRPTVVATADFTAGDGNVNTASVENPTSTQVEIFIWRPPGLWDGRFHFIAMGPR
jgi:hypothetical protein